MQEMTIDILFNKERFTAWSEERSYGYAVYIYNSRGCEIRLGGFRDDCELQYFLSQFTVEKFQEYIDDLEE